MNRISLYRAVFSIIALLTALQSHTCAVEMDLAWTKLAGAPEDLLGREIPSGADGAWCYVPELKGFLCYGGFTPRYTNEGWLFDPVKREWRMLWADDSLRYDAKTGHWRALLPRDIIWSRDRPGPARRQGVVYSPHTKKVYLFGGHPQDSSHAVNNRNAWGETKLGTWELDPTSLTFKHLTDDGPVGLTRGVYDSVNRLIVAVPDYLKRSPSPRTWVFDVTTGKWEGRTPAPSPIAGAHPAFSYDAKAKKAVYFTEYGETWTYDTATNAWENRKPATTPPPRRHAGFCFSSQLGVSVLHGGVRNGAKLKFWHFSSSGAFLDRPDRPDYSGTQYSDTWTYDATKNLWAELKPSSAPPRTGSIRDNLAYDSDRGACVLYDIAIGFWSFGDPNADGASQDAPVRSSIGPEIIAWQKKLTDAVPQHDSQAQVWQEGSRQLTNDSYLITDGVMQRRGDVGIVYDSKNRCAVWIAGCLNGHMPIYEDSHFQNSVVLFDMEIGTSFMRRASIPWGLPGEQYAKLRPQGGCMRPFTFDSTSGAVWTYGGSGGHMPGTHALQTYDLLTDKFSSGDATPDVGRIASGGLIYDVKNNSLVMVAPETSTSIFDLDKQAWRPGAEHPMKSSTKTHVVYDPQLGVILIARLPMNFQEDDKLPRNWKAKWAELEPEAFRLRAYAYDTAADKWADLKPAGIEKTVGSRDDIALGYDSRNRALVVMQGVSKPDSLRGGKTWILDLAANAWSQGSDPPQVPSLTGGPSGIAYDENHNVFVLGAMPKVILYRYKGGYPKNAFQSAE